MKFLSFFVLRVRFYIFILREKRWEASTRKFWIYFNNFELPYLNNLNFSGFFLQKSLVCLFLFLYCFCFSEHNFFFETHATLTAHKFNIHGPRSTAFFVLPWVHTTIISYHIHELQWLTNMNLSVLFVAVNNNLPLKNRS